MNGLPRWRTIVLDVDSTLSGIEGIDWLASLRDAATVSAVEQMTNEAMAGRIALEQVYGRRLEAIRPTRSELNRLAAEYRARLAPGARDAVERLCHGGVRVLVLSGGLRPALLPMCLAIGIDDADVHAVDITFTASGDYLRHEVTSPLTTQGGKPALLAALLATGDLPRPILAVGDGNTDAALRSVADAFCAFTGFVARPEVVARADFVIPDFSALLAHVFPLAQ